MAWDLQDSVLIVVIPGCRHTWDLTTADASGKTVLHLAAKSDDEGCMAGLILRHAACPGAGALWSTLKDASGQTPADTAYRCVVHSVSESSRHIMVGIQSVQSHQDACKLAAVLSASVGTSKAFKPRKSLRHGRKCESVIQVASVLLTEILLSAKGQQAAAWARLPAALARRARRHELHGALQEPPEQPAA